MRNRLWKLNPFIDNQNLFRVGGRLAFSEISNDEKILFILPARGHFTSLLIRYTHVNSLHAGTQFTLANLRQRYWVLSGRRLIQEVLSKCVRCHRNKGTTATQLMADLPPVRVNRTHRPFVHSGVDLCGPFMMRTSKRRGSQITKGYVALFICMTVKAVHLEPVIDLSSEAFLMAFQRFVSRRGLCTDLYADRGTNFVGARKMLRNDEVEYLKRIHHDLLNAFASKGTNFHFNPPAAPSFGGLREANIKRTKYHLKRIIGDRSITYDELATLLARIESCLNSRPLIPMSEDPSDFTCLTPGHFLIGESFASIPEPSLVNEPVLLTHRYRTMLKRAQTFWSLWSKDYLHLLQGRQKWLR